VRVALLEDNQEQVDLFAAWLAAAGHQCSASRSAKAFIKEVSHESFDVFILDWEIPDQSGLEVLDWIRKTAELDTPVMFVTARDHEQDVVTALEHGADDYLSKPVRKMELMARLAALERRARHDTVTKPSLDLPPFRIDTVERKLYRDSKLIDLTQKEYELAAFLFKHAGQLISRGHILETIWGRSADINTRTVDTHASRLRSKLGLTDESGWRLTSVYLYGYRLEKIPGQ
jgi:two-component system response regulator RegX3